MKSLYFYKMRMEESKYLFAFELGGGKESEKVVNFEEVWDKEIVSTHPTIYIIIFILQSKGSDNNIA